MVAPEKEHRGRTRMDEKTGGPGERRMDALGAGRMDPAPFSTCGDY